MISITNIGKSTQTWPYHGSSVVRLLPGETEVTAEQLAGLEKHSVFNDFVKRRLLRVNLPKEVQPKEVFTEESSFCEKIQPCVFRKDPVGETPENFENLSQRELIKRIYEITDKDQLLLLSEDSRSRVAEAAKQQLATL